MIKIWCLSWHYIDFVPQKVRIERLSAEQSETKLTSHIFK